MPSPECVCCSWCEPDKPTPVASEYSQRRPPPSSLQLVPVTRIEKFVADGGRTKSEELKKTNESESDGTFAMKRRCFTNTALPVFSGAECWFQHFHIVQAGHSEVERLAGRNCIPVFSGAECWFQHFHIVQAGHSEVERLAGRNCGVAAVCTLERRGIKCSSAADEGEAGVMDGPGEWTFGVLPISWQIGGSEKAVRERVSPTGIGPGYVCI